MKPSLFLTSSATVPVRFGIKLPNTRRALEQASEDLNQPVVEITREGENVVVTFLKPVSNILKTPFIIVKNVLWGVNVDFQEGSEGQRSDILDDFPEVRNPK